MKKEEIVIICLFCASCLLGTFYIGSLFGGKKEFIRGYAAGCRDGYKRGRNAKAKYELPQNIINMTTPGETNND